MKTSIHQTMSLETRRGIKKMDNIIYQHVIGSFI